MIACISYSTIKFLKLRSHVFNLLRFNHSTVGYDGFKSKSINERKLCLSSFSIASTSNLVTEAVGSSIILAGCQPVTKRFVGISHCTESSTRGSLEGVGSLANSSESSSETVSFVVKIAASQLEQARATPKLTLSVRMSVRCSLLIT